MCLILLITCLGLLLIRLLHAMGQELLDGHFAEDDEALDRADTGAGDHD